MLFGDGKICLHSCFVVSRRCSTDAPVWHFVWMWCLCFGWSFKICLTFTSLRLFSSCLLLPLFIMPTCEVIFVSLFAHDLLWLLEVNYYYLFIYFSCFPVSISLFLEYKTWYVLSCSHVVRIHVSNLVSFLLATCWNALDSYVYFRYSCFSQRVILTLS